MKRLVMVSVLILAGRGAHGATDVPTFSTSIETVRVDVSVLHDGTPVRGLKPEDFEVRDNAVVQPVELAHGEDKPVHLVLALDTSSSVAGSQLSLLKAAAHALVSALSPGDTVSLLTFSEWIHLKVVPDESRERAHAAIEATDTQLTTGLYDAAYAAVTLADPARGRPLVVIFGDGQDVGSWLRPEQVLRAAKASDVVVHAVIPPPEGSAIEGPFLQELTAVTGGREWRAGEDMKESFLRALDEFRARYTLQFTASPGDGWHELNVRLRKAKGKARARKGYWRKALP